MDNSLPIKYRLKGLGLRSRGRKTFVTALVVFTLCGLVGTGMADRRERHRERRHEKHEEEARDRLPPVAHPAYEETCGACHFAYQPGLLPSGSWKKILAGLREHFGEAVELAPSARDDILGYLTANAAENSPSKRSRKIMRSLGGRTPTRITDIPCIRHEHHEIRSNVFERKSIGSMSNCSACHRTADQGVYDDDHVVIPE